MSRYSQAPIYNINSIFLATFVSGNNTRKATILIYKSSSIELLICYWIYLLSA
jgi:hypothetical protein